MPVVAFMQRAVVRKVSHALLANVLNCGELHDWT